MNFVLISYEFHTRFITDSVPYKYPIALRIKGLRFIFQISEFCEIHELSIPRTESVEEEEV